MMTPDPAPTLLVQDETVSLGPLERLAACDDLLAGLTGKGVLPPLWHWLLFLTAAPTAELGVDGHRLHDGLLAHDPELPSRMWAGGRLRLIRQPEIGASLRRESSVLELRDRQGRSGRLRFVTLQHLISDSGGLLVDEEQDLVFRAPGPQRQASAGPPAPLSAIRYSLVPDSVLLFRFSALTFNGHRIHYDLDYARTTEHYAGLVVHGPLQAILLAALLHRAAPEGVLRRFEFRGVSPAFAGRALSLEAWPDPEQPGEWLLQTRDPAGVICMVAQASFENPRAAEHGPA